MKNFFISCIYLLIGMGHSVAMSSALNPVKTSPSELAFSVFLWPATYSAIITKNLMK